MNQDLIIEKMKLEEIKSLEMFLYEAIFIPEGFDKPPFTVIYQPDIFVYIDGFGYKEDDCCYIAKVNNKIVGAVWIRIINGSLKGYGNIDKSTPEFAISLLNGYRNQGIGTLLMKKMIEYMVEKGYQQASLSVHKENYAWKFYQKLGFKIIEEKEDNYIMLLKLDNFVKKNTKLR